MLLVSEKEGGDLCCEQFIRGNTSDLESNPLELQKKTFCCSGREQHPTWDQPVPLQLLLPLQWQPGGINWICDGAWACWASCREPENPQAGRAALSPAAEDLQTFAFSAAGLWFLQSSSKADVIWAETCQIFWPLWRAPNIHIPQGPCEMMCAKAKGRGDAGSQAGTQLTGCPSRASPKIQFLTPACLNHSHWNHFISLITFYNYILILERV